MVSPSIQRALSIPTRAILCLSKVGPTTRVVRHPSLSDAARPDIVREKGKT